MAFSFQLRDDNRHLTVLLHGKATKTDLMGVLDAITVDGTLRHPRRLWDLRDCELDVEYNELMELAAVAKTRDPVRGRGAVLVARDLTFGQLRIYQAFRESESNDVMVFREEEKAIEWIQA